MSFRSKAEQNSLVAWKRIVSAATWVRRSTRQIIELVLSWSRLWEHYPDVHGFVVCWVITSPTALRSAVCQVLSTSMRVQLVHYSCMRLASAAQQAQQMCECLAGMSIVQKFVPLLFWVMCRRLCHLPTWKNGALLTSPPRGFVILGCISYNLSKV